MRVDLFAFAAWAGLVRLQIFLISTVDAGIRVRTSACRYAGVFVAMSENGVADYGIVATWEEAIPALKSALSELKS